MNVEMKISEYLVSEMRVEMKKSNALINESIRLINETSIEINQARFDYIGDVWRKAVEEVDLKHALCKDLDPCKVHEVQSSNGLQSGYGDDDEFVYEGCVFKRGHFRETWNDVLLQEHELKDLLDGRPTPKVDRTEEKIELNIDWYDYQKIYEGLWCLKGTAIRGENILKWLKNVKTVDVKRVMIENNILVMSNIHGLHVCLAKKPITKQNIKNNLKHLRDHITLKQGYMENSHWESLAGYISWLRKNGAKRAILWIEDEHINHHDENYDENYVDLVLQLRKKCDTNKLILDRLCWTIAAELFGVAEDNEEVCEAQINEIMYGTHEDLN